MNDNACNPTTLKIVKIKVHRPNKSLQIKLKEVTLQPLSRDDSIKFKPKINIKNGNKNQIAARWT